MWVIILHPPKLVLLHPRPMTAHLPLMEKKTKRNQLPKEVRAIARSLVASSCIVNVLLQSGTAMVVTVLTVEIPQTPGLFETRQSKILARRILKRFNPDSW
jgi:hypothetical protein